MKAGLNNVLLPSLFNVVNNIVQYCWAWTSLQSSVTMLKSIVDNLEQCGQQNIVHCCFRQARTGCSFLAVYVSLSILLIIYVQATELYTLFSTVFTTARIRCIAIRCVVGVVRSLRWRQHFFVIWRAIHVRVRGKGVEFLAEEIQHDNEGGDEKQENIWNRCGNRFISCGNTLDGMMD